MAQLTGSYTLPAMDREQSRAEAGRVQSTSKSHAEGLQKDLEEEEEHPLQQQQQLEELEGW